MSWALMVFSISESHHARSSLLQSLNRSAQTAAKSLVLVFRLSIGLLERLEVVAWKADIWLQIDHSHQIASKIKLLKKSLTNYRTLMEK